MRISLPSIIWLTAASCVGVVRGDTVTFENNQFVASGTKNAPVFVLNSQPSSLTNPGKIIHVFPWIVGSGGVRIAMVKLWVGSPATAVASATPSATTTNSFAVVPSESPSTRPQLAAFQHASARVPEVLHPLGAEPTVEVRQMGSRVDSGLTGSAGIDITMASTVNGGSVTLNDMTQLLVFQDQVMYFELLWDTTPPGRSYSRNFTVLPTERQEDAQRLAEQAPYNADLPAFTEVPGGSSNPAGSVVPSLGGGSPPTITPVPLIPPSTQTSAAAGSATAVEPMGNPTSSPQATSHSSSSGLSTGAIAGIAVAAALVGLGLLATLIFCLVRRRRRDRLAGDSAISPGGRYGSRATPELIAQKEANASVGVEVSPHSPYSDDGGGVLAGGLRHGSAARQHQEEVPLAPGYADGPAAVSHRRSVVAEDGGSLRGSQTGRSLTPGRATPTAVRHLVEEGMTEDEIRRLEEEERELDQAIEQAGSGGRR